MRVGIGYGNEHDAYELGKQTVQSALEYGAITAPDVVLAFINYAVDPKAFVRGVRAVVDAHVPIIGGSGIGIITNSDLAYSGSLAGVAVFDLQTVTMQYAATGEIDQSEYAAGQRLGQALAGDPAAKLLLMFYDSLKVPAGPNTPPMMNASPPLIAGIESTLPPGIPIVGAGLLGDFTFSSTVQFDGRAIVQQTLIGMLWGGAMTPYVTITHGCSLQDGIYHTITGINGPVIYGIDDRPATAVIDEVYGNPTWREQIPVQRLAIGVNYGDKFGDFQEDRVVARLIAGVLPDDTGLVLFEPDLEIGTEFQFLLRDGQTMIESAHANAHALMTQIHAAGHKARFALYIDCAGRCATFSNTLTEEAAEIQAVMNQYQVPLLGFYSGVEVAPLLGHSRGLDWTGVLLVFAEA